MRRRTLDPLIRANIGTTGFLCEYLIAMPLLRRRRDNAGIVSAAGQHIGDVRVSEEMDLVRRPPGRDMVALGPNDKHRYMQIRKRDRLAVDLITSLGEIVVEEELSQIVRMHSIGHAGGVGIP